MSIVLVGSTSGSCTLQEQAVAGNTVLTLPTTSGTLITTGSSGQSIPKAALPTGSVLQVVQTVKSDTFSTTSSSFTDITGVSVSITPTSATSKILVFVDVAFGQDTAGNSTMVRLLRGSTVVYGGDASANRVNALNQQDGSSATFLQYSVLRFGAVYLDSPATTSSTTYKLQVKTTNGINSFYLNRSSTDRATGDYDARSASSITVMEIAA